MLINPGSRISEPGEAWTNTYEIAQATARYWLTTMHANGMTDVELLDGTREREKLWVFTFRHAVTGTTVELETRHRQHGGLRTPVRLHAKVYWNGSSTANPELDDFAAPGFVAGHHVQGGGLTCGQ